MVRKKKKPIKRNKKGHALSPVHRLKRVFGVTLKVLVIAIGIPAVLFVG